VTVYDCIYERYPDLFNSRYDDDFRTRKKRAIETADAVTCISEATRSELERFYGTHIKYVRVIPLGFDRDVFKPLEPHEGIAPGARAAPFLLYVGERWHYKNFGTLLLAYSTWSTRNHVDLVVVGRQWGPHEEQMLRSRGVSDRVRLLSGVSDMELSCLYRRAVALVFPSLYEGFGIPLLEAMACGCPIVASRIPSTIEVAGDCPFYFEPTSEEGLCAALDTVLARGRASSNVALGLRLCRSYSWEKTASQTLEVYHALSAPD
jgi:glycosyltransferase involved in cell wall biosynthesis